MKLVSAAKLRRAQEGAVNGRDFCARLDGIMSDLVGDLPADFAHPLLECRENIKKRRVIVISGERGLCGAFNTNVTKAVVRDLRGSSTAHDFIALGRRAVLSAKKNNWELVNQFEGLPEDASTWPLADVVREFVADFEKGEVDEVVIYFTYFKSPMTQVVTREVLLPFAGVGSSAGEAKAPADPVEYDPKAQVIISELIPVLISTRFKQAGLESKASEHAARMTAMDSATSNAEDLIDKLTLFYNRARQSTITTELIDIVGGAEATK